MKSFDWNLEPLHGGPTERLIWNPETGELAGAAAAFLEWIIPQQEEHGFISIMPEPQSIEAHDIRHSLEQMAALLYHHYRLPDELAAHYPQRPAEPSSDKGMRIY